MLSTHLQRTVDRVTASLAEHVVAPFAIFSNFGSNFNGVCSEDEEEGFSNSYHSNTSQHCVISETTYPRIRQSQLLAQWSTDGWITATVSCMAQWPRIWTSFNAFRTLLRETYENPDILIMQWRSLPTYTGCWPSIEYSKRSQSLSTMSSPRNNPDTWLTSLGSMLSPVIFALATETYYRRTAPTLLSQATPIVWNNLSTTACHFRPFQSNYIQVSVKNKTVQTCIYCWPVM